MIKFQRTPVSPTVFQREIKKGRLLIITKMIYQMEDIAYVLSSGVSIFPKLQIFNRTLLGDVHELPDVQAGFRKGRGTRDQIANIQRIIKKTREFQKNIYFCFTDYAKVFDCVDHNKLWKILKEMGIPDHLTCLLRNLYAGQEATSRTGHGATDWFQIGKGVRQGCILSPCLFNLYAEYIMRITGLEEAQAGIKIAGRNINNLRYAGDISLMAKK